MEKTDFLTSIVFTKKKFPREAGMLIEEKTGIGNSLGNLQISCNDIQTMMDNILPAKTTYGKKNLADLLPEFVMDDSNEILNNVLTDYQNGRIIATDGRIMAFVCFPVEKEKENMLIGKNATAFDPKKYPDCNPIIEKAKTEIRRTFTLENIDMLTGISSAAINIYNSIYHGYSCVKIQDEIVISTDFFNMIVKAFCQIGDRKITVHVSDQTLFFSGTSGLNIITMYRTNPTYASTVVYDIRSVVQNALAKLPSVKWWDAYEKIAVGTAEITILKDKKSDFTLPNEINENEKWFIKQKLFPAAWAIFAKSAQLAYSNRESILSDCYIDYVKKEHGLYTSQTVSYMKDIVRFSKIKTAEEARKNLSELYSFYAEIWSYTKKYGEKKYGPDESCTPLYAVQMIFKSAKEHWKTKELPSLMGNFYDTMKKIYAESLEEEAAAEESKIEQKEQKQTPIVGKTEPAESWMKKHVIFCRCSFPAPDKSEKPVFPPGPLTKAGSVSLRSHPFYSVSKQSQPETAPISFTPFSSVPAPESAVSALSDRVYIPPGVPLPETHFNDSSGVSGGLSPGLEKHPDLHIAGMPDHPP